MHISHFRIQNLISFHWWINKISGVLKPHLEESSDTSGLSAKQMTPFLGEIIRK